MSAISIILLGLAMSTDAFAAALGRGAGMRRPNWAQALRIGLIFAAVETQAWVALPDALEECEPSFHHIDRAGVQGFDDGGGQGHLIAGSAFVLASAVPVHSPLFYIHWTLPADARTAMRDGYAERAAYVASGTVEIGGTRLGAGQLAVFRPGASPVIRALAPSVVMALGGDAVGPRFIDWNFVSSSKERIAQAKIDWRAGRMKLPEHDCR